MSRVEINKLLASDINLNLSASTPDERLIVFEIVTKGYCRYCGHSEDLGPCQCMNDE